VKKHIRGFLFLFIVISAFIFPGCGGGATDSPAGNNPKPQPTQDTTPTPLPGGDRPALSFSAQDIDFGAISNTSALTITNNSDRDVTVTKFEIGDGRHFFSELNAPFVIKAGGEITTNLIFSADSPGRYDTTLTVTENTGSGITRTIPMTGCICHYYVDSVNGSDSNDGTQYSHAFATIKRGLEVAEEGNLLGLAGNFYEDVTVSKKIGIYGVCAVGRPVIHGRITTDALNKNWNGVTFSNLIIKSSSADGLWVDWYAGENSLMILKDVLFNNVDFLLEGPSTGIDGTNCLIYDGTFHYSGCVIGGVKGLTFRNCKFDTGSYGRNNYVLIMLGALNDSGPINIENCRFSCNIVSGAGNAIYMPNSPKGVTIKNSIFSGYNVALSEADNVIIRGNTFLGRTTDGTPTDFSGIILNACCNSEISENKFQGFDVNKGIILANTWGATRGCKNVKINKNLFTDCPQAHGVRITAFDIAPDPDTTFVNVEVTQNNFEGITKQGYGIYNSYPDCITVDAQNNWWGDANGPNSADPATRSRAGNGCSVSAGVNYKPWLTAAP